MGSYGVKQGQEQDDEIMLEEEDIDDDEYGNPSYRPTVIRSRTASRSKPVGWCTSATFKSDRFFVIIGHL